MIGAAISTEEAIAACQSPVGARVTACGWVPGAADGYTASATPAASEIGSAPGTRVVLRVATVGKPSLATASGACESIPTVTVAESVRVRSLVDPQPASATAKPSRIESIGHRIRADVSGRPDGPTPIVVIRAHHR